MKQRISADIDIKQHYSNFINKSKVELYKIEEELKKVEFELENKHQYLFARKEEIASTIGLILDDYAEFTDKEFVSKSPLTRKTAYYKTKYKNTDTYVYLIIVTNYCRTLAKRNDLLESKYLAEIKVNLTFAEYQKYLFDYYSKVHEVLLNGEAYKTRITGSLHIDRYKFKHPVRIDLKETGKNYRKIIKSGGLPFNQAEADWCTEHGYEYEGIKYKVNHILNYAYKIRCTDYGTKHKIKIDFIPSNYINIKYRNLTYQEIIDNYCKTLEDIYRLQVCLRVKLKLLLLKFPGMYVNFVRDVNKQ